jgi:hypothetical protein
MCCSALTRRPPLCGPAVAVATLYSALVLKSYIAVMMAAIFQVRYPLR